MDREKRRIERVGIKQTGAIGVLARTAALRAFQTGASPIEAAKIALRDMLPVLADGMLAAHMTGSLRASKTGAAALKRRLRFDSAYDEALRLLREKARSLGIDPDAYGTLFAQAAASRLVDISAVLEQKLTAATAEIIRTGVHTQRGMEIIRQAFDAAGITVQNPYQLETAYRLEVGSAYAAGRLAVIQNSPDLQSLLWGWEYVTVGDDRVRPTHAALDGTRKPKDDPFWVRHTPPIDYGCRCSTLEIYKDEADLASDSGAVDALPPDEGFTVSPAWRLVG